MKILFSPVGMTDPIRYFRDGALLNICRNYRPDKVYLYMSKEILSLHEKDDRYRYCLEKLGELIEHTFDVELIERPELEDVQVFDAFISDLRHELGNIHDKYPDAELLLNVSSGTPAMKSALQLLSLTLNFKSKPIQVATPQKSSNPRIDEEKDLTPEEHWELNESNDEADDRCSISDTNNMLKEFEKQNVIKLIKSYDYAASYSLAKDSGMFTDKFLELLLAAASRLKLETAARTLFQTKYNFKGIFTNDKFQEYAEIEEYLLLLSIKIKKEEYADFMRSITPVLVDLFAMYLKKRCGFDTALYTKVLPGDIIRWDMTKLPADILADLNILYAKKGGFRKDDFNSESLYNMILIRDKDSEAEKIADKLRNIVEKRLRNKAAHTIISVTDKNIKAYTGFTSDEIYKMLVKFLKLCGYQLNENFYDKMNDVLISEIR